jgi:hypothetical protein
LIASAITKISQRFDPEVGIQTQVNLRDMVSYQRCNTHQLKELHEWQ